MTNSTNSYKLIIASVLVALVILLVIVFVYYSNKKSESFDSTQTSNGIIFLNSNNETHDLNTFKTNRNSVLLIDSNGNLKNLGFPLGLIIPWAPSNATATLPNGWSLCNGQTTYTDLNGTTRTVPNLLNRFVLGAGTRLVGSVGGEETVTLQSNQIPPHQHYPISTDTIANLTAKGGCTSYASTVNSVTTDTTTTGGGLSHNNMPPYYVLKYICYTGIQSTQTQSPNNIVISDDNGNIRKYNTTNNSLIMTNSNGNINSVSFVVGMIMIWDRATNIPSGWTLCDGKTIGQYTVPDLRSRFILGDSLSKPYPSQPGGEEKVSLSISTIPNHSHSVTRAEPASKCYAGGWCSGGFETIDSRSADLTRTSGNTGDGTPHNNMPPYYVLVYICYVGNIDINYGINSFKNIMITNTNSDLTLYQTKIDSVLISDSNGSIKNLSFPKGLIIAWYNIGILDLPPGWSLCDGTIKNGYTTPNLRDKFIYGYDSRTTRTIGNATDGEEQVQLQVTHLPPHNHSVQAYNGLGYDGYASNCYGTYRDGGLYVRSPDYRSTGWGNVGNTSGNGTADPHNNMPPYFVLTYICYTGENL